MRKARFTEHQIFAAIKSLESRRIAIDVYRGAGISRATYYNSKSRYGGIEVSCVKKQKDLEDENGCLKQKFADLCLWTRG